MKKKLWYMGEVYDLANTSVSEIEMDIEKRLLDYTKLPLKVQIKEISTNELEVKLIRGLNEPIRQGSILEQDCWLITGEGYNDFVPIHTIGFYYAGLNALYYRDMNDFVADYKRNALHYGGKRSRVKDVMIDEQPNSLLTVITYG